MNKRTERNERAWKKITIDIIGGGRIGRMHGGSIYTGMQDVTIKYVSDIYPQAAQQ